MGIKLSLSEIETTILLDEITSEFILCVDTMTAYGSIVNLGNNYYLLKMEILLAIHKLKTDKLNLS